MSKFLNLLHLVAASDKDDGRWILTAPLQYQSDLAERTILVPAGFQTDLASVPRLPLIYWLTGDTSSAAAVVHDWLYQSHEVDRKTADRILEEASAVTGVPWWRRKLMFWGVRIGGSTHWDKDTAAAA